VPVRCKFVVESIQVHPSCTEIHARPVCSSDPNHVNRVFSDATPAGDMRLIFTKGKPAAELFEIGREYFVDITPAG
jgi:hypothetical protein